MEETRERNIVASLLDLPEFEPERALVRLPRLGLELEVQEVPYNKLVWVRRQADPQIHLLLASISNHPEIKQEAWYHDQMGCATPADALKKLLRMGEVENLCRVIDRLNGYGTGSVVPVSDQELEARALTAAVEELEKN